MKKKILFVLDSLQSGGAEKSLVTLLNAFDYDNYEVDLLLIRQKGLFLPLVPEKVNMLHSPDYYVAVKESLPTFLVNMLKKKSFRYIFSRIATSLSLRNPFKRKGYHTAQINWQYVQYSIPKLEKTYDTAIAFSQGVPTYFVANKVDAKNKITWINTDYELARFNKSFDEPYYTKFNRIVAISDQCKESFTKLLPNTNDKIHVIYDPVSPSFLHNLAESGEGFDDDYKGIRILSIGRLVESKGHELAIEACSKLIEAGYDLRWYVIGEGEEEGNLKERIRSLKLEQHFHLLGVKQNPYPYLLQSDLYVHASRIEGFGLAIQEARIFKKPIVTTNFTVVTDQITHNQNGIIVEMNADAIFNGVKQILDDESLRTQIKNYLELDDASTEDEIHKLYAII
ncbi:glycosyltransferase [Bacillus sp. JJ664]